MVWAAALLLLAGELWTASELRRLRETEDVRDASAIAELDEQVPAERQILAPHVARADRRALLAAARLDHPKAGSAVRRFLAGAEPQ